MRKLYLQEILIIVSYIFITFSAFANENLKYDYLIENTDGFKSVIYGSLGSSSSQIFSNIIEHKKSLQLILVSFIKINSKSGWLLFIFFLNLTVVPIIFSASINSKDGVVGETLVSQH